MSIGYKILAGLLLMAALVGAYMGWEHHIYQQGWDARDDQAKVEAIEIEHDMQKKHDKDVAAAKAETDGLRLKFDTEMADRAAKEKGYENQVAALQSAARAGNLRLSVAVRRCSLSAGTAPGNSAAASGTGAEARADVMPETAAAILGIAADSAKDVRDYNRVVDLYNAARATCNAVTTP